MLRITVALTLASLPALAGDPDVYVLTMTGNPGIASSSHTVDELAELLENGRVDLRVTVVLGCTRRELVLGEVPRHVAQELLLFGQLEVHR